MTKLTAKRIERALRATPPTWHSTCLWCHVEFSYTGRRHYIPRYCSDACRAAGKSEQTTRANLRRAEAQELAEPDTEIPADFHPATNPAWQARLRSARWMLSRGISDELIIQEHGRIVLREAKRALALFPATYKFGEAMRSNAQ